MDLTRPKCLKDKSLRECGIGGHIPQYNNSCIQVTHSQLHPNWERLETVQLRSGIRQGWLLSPLLFSIALKALEGTVMQEKKIKGLQMGRNVKLSLFTDSRAHNKFTRKLLEMIN